MKKNPCIAFLLAGAFLLPATAVVAAPVASHCSLDQQCALPPSNTKLLIDVSNKDTSKKITIVCNLNVTESEKSVSAWFEPKHIEHFQFDAFGLYNATSKQGQYKYFSASYSTPGQHASADISVQRFDDNNDTQATVMCGVTSES